MVREGYKQTEVGVIPKDWEVEPLNKFIDKLEAGVSVNSLDEEKRMYGHDESVLKTSSVYGGNFYPSECKKITLKDIRRARVSPVKETIIISRMNTPALVGECGYVAEDFDKLFLPDRLWMTRFNSRNRTVVRWLAYLLSYEPINKSIKDTATGTSGSMKNIAKNALLGINLPCPPILEQQAIAKALSDVDGLIDGLDKLIAKKRDIKTATMQQLLTGKTRLPGFGEGKGYKQTELGEIPVDWQVVSLGNVGQFKNGINKGNEDFGHGYPFVNLMDVFGVLSISHPQQLGLVNSSDGERKLYDLTMGDVLFIRSSVKPSGVGLTTVIINDLHQTVFSGFLIRFRDHGSLDIGYKAYCFSEESLRKRIIASSTVSANTNINQESLKKISITYPTLLTEQQAVAKVLSDMDKELYTLRTRLDKTKSIKQGMMQELLTGKTRLI